MFSWYKYLINGLVFSRLGFWSGNLFLIAPFPDLCLLVPFFSLMSIRITCVMCVCFIHVKQNIFSNFVYAKIGLRYINNLHSDKSMLGLCPAAQSEQLIEPSGAIVSRGQREQ